MADDYKRLVVLLPHVKQNNLDADGKLQPGNYNVSYHGVMSFAPMYSEYDGETWEGKKWTTVEPADLTEDDYKAWDTSIMYVYVREN